MKRRPTGETDTVVIEFVNEITSLLSSQIVKIIFFGSRAKGIPTPGSDYDFLIVLAEKNRTIVEELYNVVTDFLIRYDVDISLKIYREKEFQEMTSIPTPFMESVLRTGKELWSQETER
jgi:predicted nucleotidyltransferase